MGVMCVFVYSACSDGTVDERPPAVRTSLCTMASCDSPDDALRVGARARNRKRWWGVRANESVWRLCTDLYARLAWAQ